MMGMQTLTRTRHNSLTAVFGIKQETHIFTIEHYIGLPFIWNMTLKTSDWA